MGNAPDKMEDRGPKSTRVVSRGLKRTWGSGRLRGLKSGGGMKYGYSVEVLVRN